MIVSYNYKVIKSTEDHYHLQQDLNTLVEWTKHAVANDIEPN